ncbi:MAG TPA: S41 family peptidase, partial [Candidatus Limnocylindrales bacterium]|nr:S41 family peptidase [Candidatus Limnocylindrales bacterium]
PVTTAEPPAPPAPPAPSGPPAPPGAGRRRSPILLVSIALVAVLAGAGLFVAGWTVGSRQSASPGTPAGDEALFAPFWSAYHFVVDNYAGGTVDRKAIVDGAIKGMIAALGDPYSSYLTSDEFKQSLQGINGEFEGIGAEIATKDAKGADSTCTTLGNDCRLTIVAPLQGSPAEKAGLKPADVVTAVDGQPVTGQTVDQVRDRIRGPKGSKVTLSILRGATPMQLAITRDVIQQQEVTTKDLAAGKIGYIRIAGFSDTAANAVADAVKKDVGAGEKALILDLRGNPGGFVTAARSIASQFVGSGPIYWQQDAKGNKLEVDAEPGGAATDPSIKVVVLIDKGSASASEIVAAALKESDRATLVGDTSYGKGTVQQWHDLSDDNGGFRLTVARWLTPQQHWIHGVGITPDVKVTVPANTAPGQDPQLDRAVQLLTTQTSALDRAA